MKCRQFAVCEGKCEEVERKPLQALASVNDENGETDQSCN